MQAVLVFAAVVFAVSTLGLYAGGREKAALIAFAATAANTIAYLVLKNLGIG